MKLLPLRPRGQEKPGLIDADGKIRDLSGVSPISAAEISPRAWRSSPRSIRRRCRWSRDRRATACRHRHAASSSRSA
jgi:hypothetical protein